MNFIAHRNCNDVLVGPKGEEDACDDLPIQRAGTKYADYVVNCVVSFWKPNAEELALLNANGCVQLCVIGRNHPPLVLDVIEN